MCVIKYYTLSHKLVWRTLGFSACFLLVLGALSFGFGMKLLEYAEKAEITPLFAGIPMVAAGILGIVAALSKKKWAVTTYAILCVIVSMLSIHMNYRFMGKELPSLSRYEQQCETKPKDQYHCDQYLSTIILCGVSVSMLLVFLTGFLACLAARRLLQEKDCHVIWFTCSKVEPERHPPTNARQARRNKQRNKQIVLSRYKKSTEKIYEINEINQHKEFLPRIPDFKDLAGNSNNPGYPASVINTGEYSDMIGRSGKRNHEFEADLRDFCGTRDIDLGLYEEKDHRDPEEYYGRAAEDWIERMVDNFYSTRTRLYGVSDDEEIDDEPDQESALKSNEKRQPYSQNGELLDISTNETSSPKKSEILKISEENFLSSNINIDPNNIQYDGNSTTKNQSGTSAESCGPLSKDTDTNNIVPLYEVSCTQGIPEATPLGLITPTGDLSPTGALYFEFEKVASAHGRKNWVEFDRMA